MNFLDFPVFSWVYLDFLDFLRIFQIFWELSWIFREFSWIFWIFREFSSIFQVFFDSFPKFSEDFQNSENSSRFSRLFLTIFLDFPWIFQIHSWFHRDYWELSWIFWVFPKILQDFLGFFENFPRFSGFCLKIFLYFSECT